METPYRKDIFVDVELFTKEVHNPSLASIGLSLPHARYPSGWEVSGEASIRLVG